jgi:hypothetical protein
MKMNNLSMKADVTEILSSRDSLDPNELENPNHLKKGRVRPK